MIKEIELTNWKSFSSAKLFIDPVTVLIGTNASGKSNALEALIFLQRIARGVSLTEALAGNANLPGLRGGLEWATMKGASDFTLSILVAGMDDSYDLFYSISAEIDSNKYRIIAESLCKKDRSQNFDVKYRETYVDISHFYSILSYWQKAEVQGLEGLDELTSTLQDVFILDPIPSHMRGFSPLADMLNPDASNIAGVMAALSEDKKKELENAVDQYVRHLPERDIQRIWAEPVGRFQSDAMLYCDEQWQPGSVETVDARGMSDGTLRFLAILTALITRPSGILLVIEDVDNGLHPSRVELLLRMLKEVGGRRGVDVLVTTHNPALLDTLGPEMIPSVTVAHRDPQTGHSQLTLLEDVARLPKLLAGGSVGRLSSSGKLEQTLSRREGE
ncbi:MAG: AAA family ATPase [Magnetococcus sp. YQC-5]